MCHVKCLAIEGFVVPITSPCDHSHRSTLWIGDRGGGGGGCWEGAHT